MKKSLTIRLEPTMQTDLEKHAPEGVPTQAVLAVLLTWGMERAKGMSAADFVAAITRHSMASAARAAEQRLKRAQEGVTKEGGPFGHLYPDPEE